MIATLCVITASVLVFVYYNFDPSTGVYFPKCPSKLFFDLPCPGCGSQRAVHALLHLDFAGAMRYNAMVVIFIPIMAVLITASLIKHKHPRFHSTVNSPVVAYSIFALVLLWWAARLIFGWYV